MPEIAYKFSFLMFVSSGFLYFVGEAAQALGDHWITYLLERFGIPLSILGVVFWFIGKYLWPYIDEQTRWSRAQVEASRKEYIEALQRQEDSFKGHLTDIVTEVRQLSRSIQEEMNHHHGN